MIGQKLLHYEVLEKLGEGGMGVVYKARDTHLDRLVALKVLPREAMADADRKRRFVQEAKSASALNHPNIVTIYDISSDAGVDFIAMEFVEGATLDHLIAHRELRPKDALKYAVQIADALARAHGAGIVHRDLKPANVMVTKDGLVKVLDFGLAKLAEVSGSDALGATQSMRISHSPRTQAGMIIGTVAYMSPEQAEGKKVDARSDIFSFGSMLYEMFTGRRAFQGETRMSTLASILTQEPELADETLAKLPRELERLIRRCLRKEPARRVQTMADLKVALEELRDEAESATFTRTATVTAPAAFASEPRSRERAAWALSLLLFVSAALLAVTHFRGGPQRVPTVRSSLLPPSGWFFERSSFAVSPDGTRLAFVAFGQDGGNRLWVRALSAGGAQQLDGTEGALLPFWSPDSRRIGFFAAGKLKTVELGSGAVRAICEAPVGRCGGAWGRDGNIVFAPAVAGPLYRVLETGGTPGPVTSLPRASSGQSHRWPFFLPDGKHFLYFADWSTPDDPQGNGVYVGSLDGSPAKLVSSELVGNVAFAGGNLFYGRDRNLRVQAFDPDRLQLNSAGASIAQQEVQEDPGLSHSDFSVSGNGVLVFQSLADSMARLTWFDARGKELGDIPALGYSHPRLSPNGRFLAVASDDARNGKPFVRVYDLARGGSTRLTEEGNEESPVWSPDGRKITYSTSDGKFSYVKEVPSDGSAPPQVLLKGARMRHLDWSPDGHLLFSDFSDGPPSLKVYSASTRKVAPFGARVGAEGRFSPDGKWIVYTGLGAVFVQPFPGPGGRIEISTAGGAQPTWAPDGKQIFYVAPDRKLMAVTFNLHEKSVSAPRVVFQTRIVGPNFVGTQYEVAADNRLLINSAPSNYSAPLTLVTGWTAQ